LWFQVSAYLFLFRHLTPETLGFAACDLIFCNVPAFHQLISQSESEALVDSFYPLSALFLWESPEPSDVAENANRLGGDESLPVLFLPCRYVGDDPP
jgi:hypothetical protein